MSNARTQGLIAIANCCGSYVLSHHRHDLCSCKCEKSFIDGGAEYTRTGGDVRVLNINEVRNLNLRLVDEMKARAKKRFAKANALSKKAWLKFRKENPDDARLIESIFKKQSI